MASIINVLDTSNILNHTTTKIVKNIEAVGNQSLQIDINGLNINTNLNLYVDFKKVNLADVSLIDRPAATFSTDGSGRASFVFYYKEDLTQLNELPEAKYLEFISKNTGKVLLVVVDKASIDTPELPATYKTTARCYAEKFIERSYTPTLQMVQDIKINEIASSSSGTTTSTTGATVRTASGSNTAVLNTSTQQTLRDI